MGSRIWESNEEGAKMATSHPQASPILCASFNQDNSYFSIGTRDGFKVFHASTGRLCYEKSLGAFSIVEMLFSSSLLAIVGAGEQPSLSPRRLCLFNKVTGAPFRELNFLTSILAIRVNRKRLIVLLQDKTYIYDLNSLAILDTIDTVPNAKGLCAFAPGSEGSYLALPASTERGSVLIYNTIELSSLCQIDAHRSAITAIAFCSSGMFLATASEQGTIIRVHLVSQATKSYSFRRGSLHVFFLGSVINERSRKPSTLLGSMIPDSFNDAFESGQHHVIHNVVPVGVKSHAVIYSLDNVENTSTTPAIRACIYIINHNGYFHECTFNVRKSNDTSWSIEREHNLLDAIADNP
ncbi:autophagy-related protein 18b isoform X2 [Dioscorea cayenensis subsp. rotundata]|uniref:Autophagy-related protein 18b isoform X2 n=1 Tax=Dioscorea cayennensis subsp. rotundata TaxID=55577 RepID=A0AB40AX05_DIOCR|nr:autophagy-related protein 18b isoform X2 [Dioscorea cayenensis subsp. rotundata]